MQGYWYTLIPIWFVCCRGDTVTHTKTTAVVVLYCINGIVSFLEMRNHYAESTTLRRVKEYNPLQDPQQLPLSVAIG